jgi:hypothetical protein
MAYGLGTASRKGCFEMTRFMLVASVLIVALETVATAQAQATLDISKITCEQFAFYKITDPQNIAIWLSGYYNGKRGNTILDTQRLIENSRKLQDYCLLNSQTPVIDAVEVLVSAEK